MTETGVPGTNTPRGGEAVGQEFAWGRSKEQNVSGIPGLIWYHHGSECDCPRDTATGHWVAVCRTVQGREWIAPALVREVQRDQTEALCQVEVDEVVRLAVGFASTEESGLIGIRAVSSDAHAGWSRRPKPGHAPRIWWGRLLQRIFPTVNVMAAATKGEFTLAEQNAVLLETLTLDALGVKSGDEVKLTSVKKSPNAVRPEDYDVVRVTKTVKAYAEDEYVRQIRGKATDPATDGSRDRGTLPRIWIGGGIRSQLGVVANFHSDPRETSVYDTNWASGALLVSPSRRFVLVDHFREAALVAAFGLVGVAVGIDDPYWLKALLLVSALVLPAALILWRIRTRLR